MCVCWGGIQIVGWGQTNVSSINKRGVLIKRRSDKNININKTVFHVLNHGTIVRTWKYNNPMFKHGKYIVSIPTSTKKLALFCKLNFILQLSTFTIKMITFNC